MICTIQVFAVLMKKITTTVLCFMVALSLAACGQNTEYSDSAVTETDTYPNVSMELFDKDIKQA